MSGRAGLCSAFQVPGTGGLAGSVGKRWSLRPQSTELSCCLDRRAPERILFCGWRRDMHDMIAVLDAFVCPGSELWLYNEVATPGTAALTSMLGRPCDSPCNKHATPCTGIPCIQ